MTNGTETMGLNCSNARMVQVGSEQYHDIAAVSNSMLKAFDEDPELCHASYVAKNVERKETKAFWFGTALERLVFFDELPNFVQIPQNVMQERRKANSDEVTYARAGAPYKQWAASVIAERGDDVELLTAADYCKKIEPLEVACDRLREHDAARALLWGKGAPHVTLRWDDASSGVVLPCKCQMDILNDAKIIVDLKTCTPSALKNKRKLEGHIAEFRYYWQAWWYRHAMFALTGELYRFAFVFVQSDEPFRVMTIELDDEWYELAEIEIREAFARLSRAWESGIWRDENFGKVVKLGMPNYMNYRLEGK